MLSALYLIKEVVQGRLAETNEAVETSAEGQDQRQGQGQGKAGEQMESSDHPEMDSSLSKPPCPEWTNQEELDSLALDIYGTHWNTLSLIFFSIEPNFILYF